MFSISFCVVLVFRWVELVIIFGLIIGVIVMFVSWVILLCGL